MVDNLARAERKPTRNPGAKQAYANDVDDDYSDREEAGAEMGRVKEASNGFHASDHL
jgi:hypothetical protein